ncbi:MAG: ABC transporter substrate-binding protein [Chitinophagaceae bacterium]|nr:ABC transporter substrate-binding protein [Chitinophagaceae bacterium]
MPVYIDQTGRTIKLKISPHRIISLVPSQTELLYDLGLNDNVIAITKFCVYPNKWFLEKTKIGGTKNINIPLIRSLNPDLIIANKEENVKEQVEELATECPVWISDVNSLEDAYTMIGTIGCITKKNSVAQLLISRIKSSFAILDTQPAELVKAAYLIWNNPLMAVGSGTFINSMMEKAGFENIYRDKKRYPITDFNEIKAKHCRVLLLSTEPYPFSQIHISSFQQLLPGIKIILADGEIFSWYGSRLLKAPDYFSILKEKINKY